MSLEGRLTKAENQFEGANTKGLSLEMFNGAVNKLLCGLNRLGFSVTLDQVRRLAYWGRTTNEGWEFFHYKNTGAIRRPMAFEPCDVGLTDFNTKHFNPSHLGLAKGKDASCPTL